MKVGVALHQVQDILFTVGQRHKQGAHIYVTGVVLDIVLFVKGPLSHKIFFLTFECIIMVIPNKTYPKYGQKKALIFFFHLKFDF